MPNDLTKQAKINMRKGKMERLDRKEIISICILSPLWSSLNIYEKLQLVKHLQRILSGS